MKAADGLRVLLISPNRERSPDIVPPLAFAHLGAVLNAAGIAVSILDLQLVPDGVSALELLLQDVDPHVVGLSIRNLDNCAWPDSVSFLPDLTDLVEVLLAKGVPVIVGGAGASIMPEAVLTLLGLDVAVNGEGEQVIVPLVRALAAGEPIPSLPGVVVREDGGVRSTPPAPIPDLGTLPRPDYSILDPAAYDDLGGVVGVQTRRGCPFRCSYCVYPSIEGNRNRLRPPEQVADDFKRLHEEYGIARFFIVDSVFNEPESHALKVARAIGALDLPIRYGCYLTPRKLSLELAEALRESGCEGGEFGTDSLSEEVLTGLGKPFRRRDVEETIATCKEAGLPQIHHLIFGGPGETPATVQETLKAAEAAAPDALVAMAGVRVYPHTALADTLTASGVELPDLLMPYQYVSPAVVDSIEEILLNHAREHAGWILPGSGHNCNTELFDRIRKTGYRGPAWALLRRMRL